MRRNIFAFTPPGSGYYPEYLSINREPDGSVTVTARSPAYYGPERIDGTKFLHCGATATMTLPPEQFRKLVGALALEPDLWPGSQHVENAKAKLTNADVGKPHGEPLV